MTADEWRAKYKEVVVKRDDADAEFLLINASRPNVLISGDNRYEVYVSDEGIVFAIDYGDERTIRTIYDEYAIKLRDWLCEVFPRDDAPRLTDEEQVLLHNARQTYHFIRDSRLSKLIRIIDRLAGTDARGEKHEKLPEQE